MSKLIPFFNRLEQGVLVSDGAMGTMLQSLGAAMPYDNANITHPDRVESVHSQYVDAGAELIETNTYGANGVKLAQYALENQVESINRQGVKLARKAADGKAYVFGAIGPCGKPLGPFGLVPENVAYDAFLQQAGFLISEGVDGIVLETFADISELEIAVKAVRAISVEIPIIAQKTFIEDGETLSGGLPEHFARTIASWGIKIAGANCTVGPQRMLDIARSMASVPGIYVSSMPTPGLPQLVRGKLTYDTTPEYYAKYVKRLVEAGVRLVGGCCGSTPEHIREVCKVVRDVKPAKHSTGIQAMGSQKAPAVEIPESLPSKLARSLEAGEYVITVELDLPRGVDMTKVLSGARSLKEKGAHCIDISDGARARLRMNPIAVAHLVQEQVGIEAVMHMACRDRNMLALQADLLGAYTLGIKSILGVTGDPAQIGDYPTATSVYDLDSVGLVRILKRFNEGYDMAGNSIGIKTNFTIAVAFDPLSREPEQEKEKLRRKVEAGAQVIYTQPIFEMSGVEKAAEWLTEYKLPLLVGIMPLRSQRHTEFMHNEVPGIHIPDWILKKMSESSDEDGAKIGIELSQNLVHSMRDLSQGVYLMPPFGNCAIAEKVMEAVEVRNVVV